MTKNINNSRNSIKSISVIHKTFRLTKKLLYFSLIALIFSSCSSDDNSTDNNTSNYYFKATLDGREINFYNANFQGSGNDGTFSHITIAGFEDHYPTAQGTAPNSLDFEIWRIGGDIKAGTYSTTTEPEMVSRYAVQIQGGTIVYSTQAFNDTFTVKIESISRNGIKGTFSGKLRNLNSGEAIEVTEGSFNLPYEDIINP
jgi:hypothetical protein